MAFAQDRQVVPEDWQLGFQPAATPVAERIHDFNDLLLVIITAIVIFVMGLLIYVIWKFRESQNPNPSQTTHNTLIEVVWTVVPVMILVVIAIPSFRLLYYEADQGNDASMTIKVTGNTWFWNFDYPDHGDISFAANMIQESDLKPGEPRLLAVDNVAYMPSETTVRFEVTSNDTLHSFAMPAFGVKMDAVPGRLNETWAYIPKEWEGTTFYGQCSELCGVNHAYMPAAIKVVSQAEFDAWVKATQSAGLPPKDFKHQPQLAAN